jgi:hypothetical protein
MMLRMLLLQAHIVVVGRSIVGQTCKVSSDQDLLLQHIHKLLLLTDCNLIVECVTNGIQAARNGGGWREPRVVGPLT